MGEVYVGRGGKTTARRARTGDSAVFYAPQAGAFGTRCRADARALHG